MSCVLEREKLAGWWRRERESLEMKLELRQYSVMGHTYVYRGYERFIIVNVTPDTGM